MARSRARSSSGGFAWLLGALLSIPLHASVGRAGLCDMDRTYLVVGSSDGVSTWNWEVDSLSGTCGPVLPNGAPAADLVSEMVDCINTAAGSAIAVASGTEFELASCDPLVIDGMIVPDFPATISFNPQITQLVPEPSSLPMLVAGALALSALHRRRR